MRINKKALLSIISFCCATVPAINNIAVKPAIAQENKLTTKTQLQLASTVAPGQVSATAHRAPVLGADMVFADWPHILIESWQDREKSDEMAAAFKSAGLKSLRFSFHSFYSPLGPEATARVKAENRKPNQFPWFPLSVYVDFIARHDFTTVIGINVEEGPDVARDAIEQFIKRGLKSKIVA